VSIHKKKKKHSLERHIRANNTIGLHCLITVLNFKWFYEQLATEFSVLSDFSKPNIFWVSLQTEVKSENVPLVSDLDAFRNCDGER
jgi:hypothetical protein